MKNQDFKTEESFSGSSFLLLSGSKPVIQKLRKVLHPKPPGLRKT